jgi:hypothetical protein
MFTDPETSTFVHGQPVLLLRFREKLAGRDHEGTKSGAWYCRIEDCSCRSSCGDRYLILDGILHPKKSRKQEGAQNQTFRSGLRERATALETRQCIVRLIQVPAADRSFEDL